MLACTFGKSSFMLKKMLSLFFKVGDKLLMCSEFTLFLYNRIIEYTFWHIFLNRVFGNTDSEVYDWSIVCHLRWSLRSFAVTEVMWADDEAVKSLAHECEAVLWIDSAKVRLPWVFLHLILRCSDLVWLRLLHSFRIGISLSILISSHNSLDILGNLFEIEAFHTAILSLSLTTAHKVWVEKLSIIVVHCAWNKELIMKQRYVLDLFLKLHKDSILEILSL